MGVIHHHQCQERTVLLLHLDYLILRRPSSPTAVLVFVEFVVLAQDSTLLHFLPFAGHTFKCSIEKFSVPQRRQSFFFVTTHMGSLFIETLVSPYDFCRNVPSSYAIAKSNASFGDAFGSVHSFSCTARFFMFKMNMSCRRLPVWAPKSHSDAIPFKECQNCSKVSDGICFLDRNLNLSSVLLLLVSKVFLQLSSNVCNVISAILTVGYLSVKVFGAAAPRDK